MVCRSSPGTRGAGGSRGTVLVGGTTWRAPLGAHWHIPALLAAKTGLLARPLWWQVAAGGGLGLGLAALGPCACPFGGTKGCPGGVCISVGEDPMLSPGFSSPPHAAVQPFGSVSPSLAHWGWERQKGREGGPRAPRGQAGDALSLLLPFNKLVFLWASCLIKVSTDWPLVQGCAQVAGGTRGGGDSNLRNQGVWGYSGVGVFHFELEMHKHLSLPGVAGCALVLGSLFVFFFFPFCNTTRSHV